MTTRIHDAPNVKPRCSCYRCGAVLDPGKPMATTIDWLGNVYQHCAQPCQAPSPSDALAARLMGEIRQEAP